MMETLNRFVDLLRTRSSENQRAMDLLTQCQYMVGPPIALLRQELDSMIRVIYLLKITDPDERIRLIEQTLAGIKWTITTRNNRSKVIRDSDMVSIANELQGWTKSVYSFGCSFIHLSNSHNLNLRPLEGLEDSEKQAILSHMRYYHGGPCNDNPSWNEVAHYIPEVMRKISSNLECYIKHLENGNILD